MTLHNGTLPPAFVISLPEAKERRTLIQENLNALGIQHSFIDAIDGRKKKAEDYPHYAGRKRRLCVGKDMTGGEIGCFLSHRAALEHIVKENIDIAIILEDDAIIMPDFPEAILGLMQNQDKWELVRFLNKDKTKMSRAKKKAIEKISPNHVLYKLQNAYGGTFAYLVSKRAAEKTLRASTETWLPIDMLIGRPWRTGFDILAIWPGVVTHEVDGHSYIGDERFKDIRQLKGWEKIAYPITRAAYKLNENIMKRVFYWK